jgi:hypothetical protein
LRRLELLLELLTKRKRSRVRTHNRHHLLSLLHLHRRLL